MAASTTAGKRPCRCRSPRSADRRRNRRYLRSVDHGGDGYDPRFLALGVRLTKQESRLDGVAVVGACLASWREAGQRLRSAPVMDLDDYLEAGFTRSTLQRLLTALPDHVAVKLSKAALRHQAW